MHHIQKVLKGEVKALQPVCAHDFLFLACFHVEAWSELAGAAGAACDDSWRSVEATALHLLFVSHQAFFQQCSLFFIEVRLVELMFLRTSNCCKRWSLCHKWCIYCIVLVSTSSSHDWLLAGFVTLERLWKTESILVHMEARLCSSLSLSNLLFSDDLHKKIPFFIFSTQSKQLSFMYQTIIIQLKMIIWDFWAETIRSHDPGCSWKLN